jgi:hypothetical protein
VEHSSSFPQGAQIIKSQQPSASEVAQVTTLAKVTGRSTMTVFAWLPPARLALELGRRVKVRLSCAGGLLVVGLPWR